MIFDDFDDVEIMKDLIFRKRSCNSISVGIDFENVVSQSEQQRTAVKKSEQQGTVNNNEQQ